MRTKIVMGLIAFWIIFLTVMTYLYFFEPQIFFRMTQYQGPGGPFVNTPQG